MRLALKRSIFIQFLAAALCFAALPRIAQAQAQAQTAPPTETDYGPLPVFEFHSGFWINLHHTLYQEAKQRGNATNDRIPGKGPVLKIAPAISSFTPAERNAWNDAVSYYAATYVDKDLLFSTELILLKNQLEDFEDCDELSGRKKKTCDAGLPAKLTSVLESAGAVYRLHQWPDHDRINRRWILRIAPVIREQGVGLSERLADIYRDKWPREKIRVDVCAYSNWAGAYTTLDPLRVTISSLDPRNQDSSSLEVLFHEASHGIAEPVQQAIIRECRQRDKAIPRDLWHALIFYTTGEVIRPVMVSTSSNPPAAQDGTVPGGGYKPYAVREGLYQRGWDDYLRLLTKFWQPYLDGQVTFDDAIAHMVSSI